MKESVTIDLSRHNELLVALHASRDGRSLIDAAGRLLRALIDGEMVGIGIYDSNRNQTVGCFSPTEIPVPRYLPAFDQISEQHPLLEGWKRAGSTERPLRISDCVSSQQWDDSPVYREFFRPLGLRHQLGVWAEVEGGDHIELSVSRAGRDFTARDVEILNLLRPHIALAYYNCVMLSRLRHERDVALQLLDNGPSFTLIDSSRYMPQRGTNGLSGRLKLTAREREVLFWVRQGKTNPEIGIILTLSSRTVQKHLEHIFHKLNVETRTAAAMSCQPTHSSIHS